MAMCQLGLMPNCNNSCKFCLIKSSHFMTKEEILFEIDRAIENIDYISNQEENWTNKFSDGISILGGEVYYLQDNDYKEAYLKLINKIIEKILKVSPNPNCRYSTVTNGNYDPNWLLFPVVDKIKDSVGLKYADINFSYDFKYRFKNEFHEKLVRDNINNFHKRYNYKVGIQMILTQYVIDLYLSNKLVFSEWIDEYFPGNQVSLLYPHSIFRGNGFSGCKNLLDFNFSRNSFLKFIIKLKEKDPAVYEAFLSSTRNSSIFKYTMLHNKGVLFESTQKPILSDGKEVLNEDCNHSILYRCYADTENCLLCDLESLEN